MSDLKIKKYAVHCLKCKQDLGNAIIIDGVRMSYAESTGILSSRLRADGHWGFECMHCGYYSLVAPEEVADVLKISHVNPATRHMLTNDVAKRMKKVKETKVSKEVDGFRMTEVKA